MGCRDPRSKLGFEIARLGAVEEPSRVQHARLSLGELVPEPRVDSRDVEEGDADAGVERRSMLQGCLSLRVATDGVLPRVSAINSS